MNNNNDNECKPNMTLSTLDGLDAYAENYKKSKESIKNNSTIIKEAIEKNTKREVEELQSAINNLNKKMELIMKSDFIKDKKEKIEKSQEIMANCVEQAATAFFEVRKIIHKKDLSASQKRTYEKKLYDKIIDKFMTPEEKSMFEKMINGNQIIVMGNPYGIGGTSMGGLPMLGL